MKKLLLLAAILISLTAKAQLPYGPTRPAGYGTQTVTFVTQGADSLRRIVPYFGGNYSSPFLTDSWFYRYISPSFIKNQSTAAQTSSSFWIDGAGRSSLGFLAGTNFSQSSSISATQITQTNGTKTAILLSNALVFSKSPLSYSFLLDTVNNRMTIGGSGSTPAYFSSRVYSANPAVGSDELLQYGQLASATVANALQWNGQPGDLSIVNNGVIPQFYTGLNLSSGQWESYRTDQFATAASVAIPANRVPFGTGTALSSDTTWYKDPTYGVLRGTQTAVTTRGYGYQNFNKGATGTVADNALYMNTSFSRNASYIARINDLTGIAAFTVENLSGNLLGRMTYTASSNTLALQAKTFSPIIMSAATGKVSVQDSLNVGGVSTFGLSSATSKVNVFGTHLISPGTLSGTVANVFPSAATINFVSANNGSASQPIGSTGLSITGADAAGSPTNGGYLSLLNMAIVLNKSISNSPNDDHTLFNGSNRSLSPFKATEAFYLGHNGSVFNAGQAEFGVGFNIDANVETGFRMTGIGIYGFDTYTAPGFTATFSGSAIRLGNGHKISARNAAGSSDQEMLSLNASDQVSIRGGAATVSSNTLTVANVAGSATSAGNLIIKPNTSATNGQIQFGSSATSTYYDWAANAFRINANSGESEQFVVKRTANGTSSRDYLIGSYSSDGKGLRSYFNTNGSASGISAGWQTTGSIPIGLGTSGANFGFYMHNNGNTVIGATSTAPSDNGQKLQVEGKIRNLQASAGVVGTDSIYVHDNTSKEMKLISANAFVQNTSNVVPVSGTTQALQAGKVYIVHNTGTTTLTLPATAAEGDLFTIIGEGGGTGTFTIAQNASQYIRSISGSTTVGATGSYQGTSPDNVVTIRCTLANTKFTVSTQQGTFNRN